MAEVEVEVSFTRIIESTHSGTLVIDVPQSVLNEGTLLSWIDEKYENDSRFADKIDQAVSEEDSCDETNWEYVELTEE